PTAPAGAGDRITPRRLAVLATAATRGCQVEALARSFRAAMPSSRVRSAAERREGTKGGRSPACRYHPLMRVADLIAAMESIAPPTLAEEWDNVGLIAGDRQAELRGSVLLTIDLTTAVVTEAREMGAGAIVAYHPPIFRPVRSLT